MGIPTVYRWDDGNAPVLTGVKGSLVNVLKKCLVEGYDAKAGAGWTLEYINGLQTKAAFRNSQVSGTGFFFLCDEESNPTAGQSFVNGYEGMTGIDSGINPFSVANMNIIRSANATSTSRPWVMIATDTIFYLFMYYNSTGNESTILTPQTSLCTAIVFGDFIKANEDSYNCLLSHSYVSVPSQYGGMNMFYPPNGTGTAYIRCPRTLSGTPGSATNFWHEKPCGPFIVVGVYSLMTKQLGPPYVSGGRLLLGQSCFGDANSVNIRGFWPGMYIPMHDSDSILNLATIVAESRTFFILKIGGLYSGYANNINLAFELGVDWNA